MWLRFPPVGYQSGRLCVELAELRAEVRADGLHDLLHSFQVLHGEYLMPVLGDENQMNVQDEKQCLPVWISL